MTSKRVSLYTAFVYGLRTVLDNIRLFFKAYLLVLGLTVSIVGSMVGMSFLLCGKSIPSLVMTMKDSDDTTKKIEISYHPFSLYKKVRFYSADGLCSLIFLILGWFLCAWVFSGILRFVFDVYNTGTANIWTVCSQKAYLFSM
ncbi:MAG TPA: hypothetical protein VEK38_04305, partial [Candidatus Bathyarchaeia archaeon]|nr:hypothetical protein [Candidatus Bathyarchaeia archaeon]